MILRIQIPAKNLFHSILLLKSLLPLVSLLLSSVTMSERIQVTRLPLMMLNEDLDMLRKTGKKEMSLTDGIKPDSTKLTI
jgi:hypothetical protein